MRSPQIDTPLREAVCWSTATTEPGGARTHQRHLISQPEWTSPSYLRPQPGGEPKKTGVPLDPCLSLRLRRERRRRRSREGGTYPPTELELPARETSPSYLRPHREDSRKRDERNTSLSLRLRRERRRRRSREGGTYPPTALELPALGTSPCYLCPQAGGQPPDLVPDSRIIVRLTWEKTLVCSRNH
jgi:hypothetical protein